MYTIRLKDQFRLLSSFGIYEGSRPRRSTEVSDSHEPGDGFGCFRKSPVLRLTLFQHCTSHPVLIDTSGTFCTEYLLVQLSDLGVMTLLLINHCIILISYNENIMSPYMSWEYDVVMD